MPNRYAWIALGAGAYLAFTLSMFPAAVAYRLFAPDLLWLGGVEGTIWSARAPIGALAGLPVREVRWRMDALPLLTARITGQASARLADGFAEGRVTASFARIRLRDVRASTRVAMLSAFLPALEAEGLLSIALDRAALRRDGWPTELVGQARIAELAVPPLFPDGEDGLIPLGDYELRFLEAQGGRIEAVIHDTGGPLEVSARLTLDSERRYRLEGAVAARAGASPSLLQGIELMSGEPDAGGKRAFELTGSL